ncbi:MAG: flagellar motor switch protein FliM [Lachnospiraceae bacterium]|nr:flagellar motor switch protein FliM [Lachnospiraceae bacterium]
MGEVLSQDEIDNLLAALSTGEIDADQMKETGEKQVRDYDFKRPAKFSKEHLRTLEIIFEHYGRLLSTNFPVYLRKNVQVSVNSSETVTFSEFTNALSNPVILSIINFQPLGGNIIMELAPNLGFAIIDRMLGGAGDPLEKTREFSEIEMTILERIMVISMQLLREPWRNVVEISPTLERIETNPQFAQIIAPSEMIAIVTLNIKIGEVEGLMNVCLPYFTLESVMDKLNTKFWFSTIKDNSDEDYVASIESMIRRVEVPVTALLGKSSISVGDFTSLQIGDVIRLDTNIDSEMDVYVGNLRKFKVVPGSNKDKYAVRVTTVIEDEQDETTVEGEG